MKKIKTHREFTSHSKLIDTVEELQTLVDKLLLEKRIALDTEFIREKTFFPQIALIQVATEKESWLIDPINLKKPQLEPFLKLLQNNEILKIFHAAQADQECFYTAYGIIVSPSFDTAAGASLLGFGESPGLSRLLKDILGVNIMKGHARTDWTVRPLSHHLIKYAHQDVEFLIPLTDLILEKLDSKKRKNWAFKLSSKYEDPLLYDVPPEELVKKILKTRTVDRKKLQVLTELIRWREKRVRELNLPRKWVADDDLLTALANVCPIDMDHLSSFRGLNKGELRNSGEQILQAIKKGIENSESQDVFPEQAEQLPDDLEASLELLQCFLGYLAEKHEISGRLLMNNELLTLCLIKNNEISEAEDLIKLKILTESSFELIGKELHGFLKGKISLSLENAKIRVLG